MDEPGDVTRLLRELSAGREGAVGELIPLVYDELRRIASAHKRREGAQHTLQPTALVHEAFIKLFSAEPITYADREHFLCVAANAMRNLLVCHVEGGELSGTVDELIRHAVSKMSHVHMVANREAEPRTNPMRTCAICQKRLLTMEIPALSTP